jgi:hypothetical protein
MGQILKSAGFGCHIDYDYRINVPLSTARMLNVRNPDGNGHPDGRVNLEYAIFSTGNGDRIRSFLSISKSKEALIISTEQLDAEITGYGKMLPLSALPLVALPVSLYDKEFDWPASSLEMKMGQGLKPVETPIISGCPLLTERHIRLSDVRNSLKESPLKRAIERYIADHFESTPKRHY